MNVAANDVETAGHCRIHRLCCIINYKNFTGFIFTVAVLNVKSENYVLQNFPLVQYINTAGVQLYVCNMQTLLVYLNYSNCKHIKCHVITIGMGYYQYNNQNKLTN